MKNVLKIFGMFIVAGLIFTACQNEDADSIAPGTEKSTGVTIDLGLPGGTDPVDADGNVTVSRNLTLTANNTYVLHNFFRIQSGFTITIEPGTHIRGAGAGNTADDLVASALVIEKGADIIADGTVTTPIVFTSNQATPLPGDWGGVVILGDAPVNLAQDPSIPGTEDGIGAIEGLPNPNNTGFYGGNNAADNSGILRYVRIEYAGNIIGAANELNGLTLGGVGNGTTIEYVQVSYGLDDGFEFFGGTVNAKYLVANRNGDDDLDTDQGYRGKIQFVLVVRDQNGSWLADFPLNGSESNGDDDDNIPGNLNFTQAQLSNVTFIGPYVNDCTGTVNNFYSSGIYFRDDSDQDLFNSVIIGFPSGIRINDVGAANFNTAASLNANLIDVRNTTIVVSSQAGVATIDDATGTNFDTTFFSTGLDNRVINASSCTNLFFNMAAVSGLSTDAWVGINNLQPDPRPINNRGGLIGSASFTGLSGFDVVTYRGAFEPGASSWLNTWTDWTF